MKITKDSLWLLTARIGTQGMAALFTILLARRLGSAKFGEYAVIAAIIFIGNMLTTFGTDMSLIREIAAHGELTRLSSALAIQIILSFFFIALTWFIAPVLMSGTLDGIRGLRIYAFVLIPLAFFTVFTSVLRGKQFADAYAWLNLTGSSLQLIFVFIFIHPGASVEELFIFLLLAQSILALIGAAICHLKMPGFWRNWRFDLNDMVDLLKVSSPLAVLTLVMMIYQKISIMIISLMSGAAMAGFFSVAQRTLEAAKTGHVAIFTALYPAMAQNKDGDFRQTWIFLMTGAAVGSTVLSALAMPVTRILFGVEYEASIPALQILAWMLIPYTASTFLTLKFVAANREAPVLRASMISLVVLIFLSLLWIPRMGLAGASLSALSAESIQAALLFFQWRVT